MPLEDTITDKISTPPRDVDRIKEDSKEKKKKFNL